jgi:hypothetical protein
MEKWKCRFIALMALSLMRLSTSQAAELVHDKDHPWPFAPQYTDRAAWETRAQTLRQQLLVAQGLWPMPTKIPLQPVIHGKIDRDAYTIEKVYFASVPGHYVTGSLYRPKGTSGKVPAVLCPYGHFPDGRFCWYPDDHVKKEIASGAETDPNAARAPLQANCAMLARMGCVVFQYDMIGYADSKSIDHGLGFLDVEAIQRLQSAMGLQTFNSIRSLDFVLSLPDVDPKRVAVAGASGGGTQTMQLAGLDDRIAVAFPMVMVGMNMQGGCNCENAPLLRVMTNNVEIASLTAPRPEGMSCANDWTHDLLTRGLPEMKSIWKLYSAEDRVDAHKVEFGHNQNLRTRTLQYEFLNKHLKLGLPEPIVEVPLQPVEPKDLSVFDADHPRPADSADAMKVRAWMTQDSDQQLAQLLMNPPEYQRVIRAALVGMITIDVNTKIDFEVGRGDWKGSVSQGEGGKPLQWVVDVPDGWDGRVIIWARKEGVASKPVTGKAALLAIDFPAETNRKPPDKGSDQGAYGGMTLGYDLSVSAKRASNLLGVISVIRVKPGVKSVELIAADELGPCALLAKTLAGGLIDRAAIDLHEFDFKQVNEITDPQLLPGALKYGGINGWLPLCNSGKTLLCGFKSDGSIPSNITTAAESRSIEQLAEWLNQ